MTTTIHPTKRSVALERLASMVDGENTELALSAEQLLDLLDRSRTLDRLGNYVEPTRVWEPTTAYIAGSLVVPSKLDGYAYRCVTAGNSGSIEPNWSASVADGSAEWQRHHEYGRWTPTYDLNYAATQAWALKAALAVTRIDFSSEGASFSRSQYIEHLSSYGVDVSRQAELERAMLTTEELTAMRRIAVEAMPDRCSIVRSSLTPDGNLGQTETSLTIASNVPCRVDEPQSQDDAELGGRIASRGELVVRLPFGTDVTERDAIEFEDHSLSVQRVLIRPYATTTTAIVNEVR